MQEIKYVKEDKKFLIKFGIPIDQNEFDQGLNNLNYKAYVEQNDEARTISKDNREFSVKSIKDL